MATGSGGAPGSGGTADTRVQRLEEGQAGLREAQRDTSLYDANWPDYPLTPATHTFGAGTSAVTVTATDYYGGLIGDNITVTLVDPAGNNVPLSVAVNGYDIVVTLATDGTSTPISTANQVAAAINGATEPVQGAGGYEKAATQNLVTAVGGGTGVVAAAPKTALSGATAATVNTFDAGLAAGVEPARAVGQVDTQWEAGGIDPWAALKQADPSKW